MIPKQDLVHLGYYEGLNVDFNEYVVARWNSETNLFSCVSYRWDDTFLFLMAYPTDKHEYFGSFKPVLAVDPKEYQKVDEL